jgi:glycosyltransferase involved in cell wall biosynthesis
MRVGFDASVLHRPFPPGVVRAVRGVLETLERRGRLEVVRLVPPSDPSSSRSLRSWRRLLPREVGARGLVGLHSFTSAFPWRGAGRRVQTIHELPWRHGVAENSDLAHRLWASLGPLRADRVVCPTEHVGRDLRARRLGGGEKIRVIPWGVGPPFGEEAPPEVVDEAVRKRIGIEEPFALLLGATREKKRLEATIRGLAEHLRRGGEPIRLAITGPGGPALERARKLASPLGVSRWISPLGKIAETDLPSLLRRAAMVPVLSRSEGFGLPVLEAMASATPVLVPPTGAQTEVAGEAGILVNPDDPASVAEGMATALREGGVRRAALLERAALFSWDAAARGVEELWEELA